MIWLAYNFIFYIMTPVWDKIKISKQNYHQSTSVYIFVYLCSLHFALIDYDPIQHTKGLIENSNKHKFFLNSGHCMMIKKF